MMVIFLYVFVFLSLSFSLFFLLHMFSKHIHFFLSNLVTTFHATNAIDNYKLHADSSTITLHVLDSPPPIGEGIEGLMITYTENLSFQTIDINDEIDDNDENDDEDENDCWGRMRAAEGKENFPPPLSSLNRNGQPSFILVPMRKNGRLQLSKVRIKRPKVVYAKRQDGRLRLFLLPDQCIEDNVEEEEEEEKDEEVVDEFDVEEKMEEEEEEDRAVEEVTSYNEHNKDTRIEELKFSNEMFRKCHQVVNHMQSHHHVHGSLQHLCMYGVGIA